jgi:hypothetical protein
MTLVKKLAPLALVAGITSAACVKPGQIPSPIPQDIEIVVACVIPLLAQGVVDPVKLEASCAPGADQLIIDVLALLGESKTLNPLVVTQARVAYVQGVRAYLKKHAPQVLETP